MRAIHCRSRGRVGGPSSTGPTGAVVAALLLLPCSLPAQGMVSGFAGSTEMGVYEADFATLATPTDGGTGSEVGRAEGRLVSRVYTKAGTTSNHEIFLSYQRELQAAGFTIHVAAEPGNRTELLARSLYSEHTPGFLDREYRGPAGRVARPDLARLGSQAAYYLVASRNEGGRDIWVAVVVCRYNDLYMVEELTTAAMAVGTVSIDLERLRSAMEANGRIAIYDIHFATGSAELEPESAAALAVIAEYLQQSTDRFYIVGHTDDTGTLEGNLALSTARATAVTDALVTRHGVDPARLEGRGVGPLSPVSTNGDDPGRALNRRVEIVQRLGGR